MSSPLTCFYGHTWEPPAGAAGRLARCPICGGFPKPAARVAPATVPDPEPPAAVIPAKGKHEPRSPKKAAGTQRRYFLGLALLLVLGLTLLAGYLLGRQSAPVASRQTAAGSAAVDEKHSEEQKQLDQREQELYFASIALAERGWELGKLERTHELLELCPPALRQWEWRCLRGLCPGGLLYEEHVGEAYGLTREKEPPFFVSTVAGNGDYLALGLTNGTVEMRHGHDVKVMQLQTECQGPMRLAFSPDRRWLAVAGVAVRNQQQGLEGCVQVWSLAVHATRPILTFWQGKMALGVAFSPVGNRLAIASRHRQGEDDIGELCVYELHPRHQKGPVLTLPPVKAACSTAAFNHKGDQLAVAYGDGTLRLFDAHTGEALHTLRVGKGAVEGPGRVAFSPNDQLVAAGTGEGSVKLWQTATGTELATLPGHAAQKAPVVAFSPDGRRLLSSGSEPTLRLWDVAEKRSLQSWTAGGGVVRDLAFFGKDEVATCGQDGTLQVFDVARRPTAPLKGKADGSVLQVVCYNAHPNSGGKRYIATAVSSDPLDPRKPSEVSVWLADEGRSVNQYQHPVGVRGLAVFPSWFDQMVMLGDIEGKVYLFTRGLNQQLLLGKHDDAVSGLAFTITGQLLATCSGSLSQPEKPGEVKVWDINSRKELWHWRNSKGGVFGVAFSPCGRCLAAGGADGLVRLWDYEEKKEKMKRGGHRGVVLAVAVNKDCELVASAGGNLHGTGEAAAELLLHGSDHTRVLRGHQQVVTSVAFSPDGKRLFSGSRDGTVKVWDTKSGRCLLTLQAGGKQVCSLALSSDGKQLVSGNELGTLTVWEAP